MSRREPTGKRPSGRSSTSPPESPPVSPWVSRAKLAVLGMVACGSIGWLAHRCYRQTRSSQQPQTSRAPSSGPGGHLGPSERRGNGPGADRRRLLSQRLRALRARLSKQAALKLSKLGRRWPAPGTPEHAAALEAMKARFQRAVEADARRFSAEELARIRGLYKEGLDGLDSAEGRAALQQLYDQFPESNRAGCAAMNLAATYLNDGEHQKAAGLLEQLIKSSSGAVFGNGERILPKALFNYGMLKSDLGDTEAARAAWKRILRDFGDELDANGIPYGLLAQQALSP